MILKDESTTKSLHYVFTKADKEKAAKEKELALLRKRAAKKLQDALRPELERPAAPPPAAAAAVAAPRAAVRARSTHQIEPVPLPSQRGPQAR